MASCPYCLEDIKDGATKCSHCQSSLGKEPSHAHSASEPVVYIVDQGLVRFGKFAVTILAIFTLVGVYLFGIDIKDTREELSEAREEIESLQDKIEKQAAELDVALSDVRAALSEVEETVSKTRAKKEEADEIVQEMRKTQLSEVELDKAKAARESRSIPKDRGKLWESGSTIRVRFLDGADKLKSTVKAAIAEWLQYANLKVEYTDDPDAEVRVSFEEVGSWSYLGTDALGIPDDQPTLNYGTLESIADSGLASQTALHEFGHALGLAHEFQNPSAGELFNREALYNEFSRPPNNWSREQVDQSFLAKDKAYPDGRPYDPFSVMSYVMDEKLFLDPEDAPKPGPHLSESDKTYIASLYPG